MNEPKCIVIGMLPKETKGYGNNDMLRRVYSLDGIAPTIRTMQGGELTAKGNGI